MNHLTPDELVDAVDAALAPDRLEHLASCVGCRDKVEQLASMFSEARAVDIAEPSPLFWERFSDRVQEAIATEPAPTGWLPRWLEWPVLLPITAMAILLLTLVSAVPRVQLTDASTTTALGGEAATALADDNEPARAADADWVVISDLLGAIDFETVQEAGFVAPPGAADQAVLLLSAAEQQELVRLLQQELKVGG
jgi:hypothetical protein